MKKNWGMRLVVLFVLVVVMAFSLVAFWMREKNFLSHEVGSNLSATIKNLTNADVHYSSFTGNPLIGYTATSVTLTKGKDILIRAREARVNLDLMSLFSNRRRLRLLELSDASSDLSSLRLLLPKRHGPLKAMEIPIDRLVLRNATVGSPFGTIVLDHGFIRSSGTVYRFRIRSGSLGGEKFKASGLLDLNERAYMLRRLHLEKGKTNLFASGSLLPDLDLRVSVSGFSLEELSRFVPKVAKARLSGTVQTDFRIFGKWNGLSLEGEGKASKASVRGIPLEGVFGHWALKQKRLILQVEEGKAFGTPLKGEVRLDFSVRKNPHLFLSLRSPKAHIEDWKEYFKWLRFASGDVTGLSLDLSGWGHRYAGRVALSSPSLSISGQPLSNVSAVIDLQKESRTVNVVLRGSWLQAPFEGKGSVLLGEKPHLDFEIRYRGLDMKRLSERFSGLKTLQLEGTASGEARLTGEEGALAVSGTALFPQAKLMKETLERVRLLFDFSPSVLEIPQVEAFWRKGMLTASGKASLLKGKVQSLAFGGRLDGLDLRSFSKEIPALQKGEGALSASWKFSGTVAAPILQAEVSIPKVRLEGLSATGITARIVEEKGRVTIESAQGKLGKGGFVLKGKGQLKPARFDLDGTFWNLSLKSLNEQGMPTSSASIEGAFAGTFKLSGGPSSLSWSAKVASPKVVLEKIALTNLACEVSSINDGVRILGLKASGWEGTLLASGDLKLARGEGTVPSVSLKGRLINGALEDALSTFVPDFSLKGRIDAVFAVEGRLDDPKISMKASLPEVVFGGVPLEHLEIGASGSATDLQLQLFSASSGNANLSGLGHFVRSAGSWGFDFEGKANGLDLKAMGGYLPAEVRPWIGGSLNLDFKGHAGPTGLSGKGKAVFPLLTVHGFRMTDLEVPFFLEEGYFVVEEGSGVVYGGKLTFQAAKDLTSSRWGGRIDIKSADLGPALHDLLPDANLVASGKLDFKFAMQGDVKRTSLEDGNGSISITNGEIRTVKPNASGSPLVGSSRLSFRSVLANFNLDGKTLYLLPGSRISANPGDPSYRYLMVDGSIDSKQRLSFFCLGNVNVRALNALVEASQELMRQSRYQQGSGSLLQNFLGGLVGGYAKSDFRDVSFRVVGTPLHPAITNLSIYNPVRTSPIPDSPEELREVNNSWNFRLTVTFPVGPGGSSDREGHLAEQVQQQILEQTFKQILNNGSGTVGP